MSQEQKELCYSQTKMSTELYFLWKDYTCRCKFGSMKSFFWSSREGIMVNTVYHQLDWILYQGADLQGNFCDGLKEKSRTLSKSGQTKYKEVWEKKSKQNNNKQRCSFSCLHFCLVSTTSVIIHWWQIPAFVGFLHGMKTSNSPRILQPSFPAWDCWGPWTEHLYSLPFQHADGHYWILQPLINHNLVPYFCSSRDHWYTVGTCS